MASRRRGGSSRRGGKPSSGVRGTGSRVTAGTGEVPEILLAIEDAKPEPVVDKAKNSLVVATAQVYAALGLLKAHKLQDAVNLPGLPNDLLKCLRHKSTEALGCALSVAMAQYHVTDVRITDVCSPRWMVIMPSLAWAVEKMTGNSFFAAVNADVQQPLLAASTSTDWATITTALVMASGMLRPSEDLPANKILAFVPSMAQACTVIIDVLAMCMHLAAVEDDLLPMHCKAVNGALLLLRAIGKVPRLAGCVQQDVQLTVLRRLRECMALRGKDALGLPVRLRMCAAEAMRLWVCNYLLHQQGTALGRSLCVSFVRGTDFFSEAREVDPDTGVCLEPMRRVDYLGPVPDVVSLALSTMGDVMADAARRLDGYPNSMPVAELGELVDLLRVLGHCSGALYDLFVERGPLLLLFLLGSMRHEIQVPVLEFMTQMFEVQHVGCIRGLLAGNLVPVLASLLRSYVVGGDCAHEDAKVVTRDVVDRVLGLMMSMMRRGPALSEVQEQWKEVMHVLGLPLMLTLLGVLNTGLLQAGDTSMAPTWLEKCVCQEEEEEEDVDDQDDQDEQGSDSGETLGPEGPSKHTEVEVRVQVGARQGCGPGKVSALYADVEGMRVCWCMAGLSSLDMVRWAEPQVEPSASSDVRTLEKWLFWDDPHAWRDDGVQERKGCCEGPDGVSDESLGDDSGAKSQLRGKFREFLHATALPHDRFHLTTGTAMGRVTQADVLRVLQVMQLLPVSTVEWTLVLRAGHMHTLCRLVSGAVTSIRDLLGTWRQPCKGKCSTEGGSPPDHTSVLRLCTSVIELCFTRIVAIVTRILGVTAQALQGMSGGERMTHPSHMLQWLHVSAGIRDVIVASGVLGAVVAVLDLFLCTVLDMQYRSPCGVHTGKCRQCGMSFLFRADMQARPHACEALYWDGTFETRVTLVTQCFRMLTLLAAVPLGVDEVIALTGDKFGAGAWDGVALCALQDMLQWHRSLATRFQTACRDAGLADLTRKAALCATYLGCITSPLETARSANSSANGNGAGTATASSGSSTDTVGGVEPEAETRNRDEFSVFGPGAHNARDVTPRASPFGHVHSLLQTAQAASDKLDEAMTLCASVVATLGEDEGGDEEWGPCADFVYYKGDGAGSACKDDGCGQCDEEAHIRAVARSLGHAALETANMLDNTLFQEVQDTL